MLSRDLNRMSKIMASQENLHEYTSPPRHETVIDFMMTNLPAMIMIAPKQFARVQNIGSNSERSKTTSLQQYSKLLEKIMGPRMQSYKMNMFGGYNQDMNEINKCNKLSIANLLTDRPQNIL